MDKCIPVPDKKCWKECIGDPVVKAVDKTELDRYSAHEVKEHDLIWVCPDQANHFIDNVFCRQHGQLVTRGRGEGNCNYKKVFYVCQANCYPAPSPHSCLNDRGTELKYYQEKVIMNFKFSMQKAHGLYKPYTPSLPPAQQRFLLNSASNSIAPSAPQRLHDSQTGSITEDQSVIDRREAYADMYQFSTSSSFGYLANQVDKIDLLRPYTPSIPSPIPGHGAPARATKNCLKVRREWSVLRIKFCV